MKPVTVVTLIALPIFCMGIATADPEKRNGPRKSNPEKTTQVETQKPVDTGKTVVAEVGENTDSQTSPNHRSKPGTR
jgi:hypothetical protein